VACWSYEKFTNRARASFNAPYKKPIFLLQNSFVIPKKHFRLLRSGLRRVLGFVVWARHMLIVELVAGMGASFTAATVVIAILTGIKTFPRIAAM
jgi:hypothetical protein